jgi:Transglycosylase SLT domain
VDDKGRTSLRDMIVLGVGVSSIVAGLSTAPGLDTYMRKPQPMDPEGVEMHVKIDPNDMGSYVAKLYLKDGKWDMDKLRDRQEEYFDFLRNNKRTGEFYSLPNAVESFMPIIKRVAKKYDVDPDIIASIIQAESFGYTYAIGNDGEMGLMQLDPNKHPKEFKANYYEIFNPEVNIDLGTSILKDYLVEFHGNYKKAVEAYNSGEHSVIRNRFPKSTREYVRSVLLRRAPLEVHVRE